MPPACIWASNSFTLPFLLHLLDLLLKHRNHGKNGKKIPNSLPFTKIFHQAKFCTMSCWVIKGFLYGFDIFEVPWLQCSVARFGPRYMDGLAAIEIWRKATQCLRPENRQENEITLKTFQDMNWNCWNDNGRGGYWRINGSRICGEDGIISRM